LYCNWFCGLCGIILYCRLFHGGLWSGVGEGAVWQPDCELLCPRTGQCW